MASSRIPEEISPYNSTHRSESDRSGVAFAHSVGDAWLVVNSLSVSTGGEFSCLSEKSKSWPP